MDPDRQRPIPQVLDVVLEKRPKDAKPYKFPTRCPCPLHTEVVRESIAGGGEGVRSRCSGEFACPFQRIEHLKHVVSRRAFDIDGLGEKQIGLFFERGWVEKVLRKLDVSRPETFEETRHDAGREQPFAFGGLPLEKRRASDDVAFHGLDFQYLIDFPAAAGVLP